ncbi:23_t:CDS:2, partial [Gigaspora margarita]
APQAPNERLNNKKEIDQERHRLEELAQRLGYLNAPKLDATVVTKNIAIESGFSSTAKKDKGKEPRVIE